MELREVGDADAYGHRHKASIGEFLADEIKRRTGIETVNSELTYDLRSGDPDAFDQMVAITFANVAMELVVDGKTAQMTAIRDGRYGYCPIPEPGARTVDVEHAYNTERYRPHYENKIGLPVLLTPVRRLSSRPEKPDEGAARRRGSRRPTGAPVSVTVGIRRSGAGGAAPLGVHPLLGGAHGGVQLADGAGTRPAHREAQRHRAGVEPAVALAPDPLHVVDRLDLVRLRQQDKEATAAQVGDAVGSARAAPHRIGHRRNDPARRVGAEAALEPGEAVQLRHDDADGTPVANVAGVLLGEGPLPGRSRIEARGLVHVGIGRDGARRRSPRREGGRRRRAGRDRVGRLASTRRDREKALDDRPARADRRRGERRPRGPRR